LDSEEKSWLTFQYIVGYCHEGRLKHWLFVKFDGELQWVRNSSLSSSKLGRSIARYCTRHVNDLLELKKPIINENVIKSVDGKFLLLTFKTHPLQSGRKNMIF
jgi:hypothetical protein